MTTVRATRGKYLRAEPVAALYEQGRVKHVGAFRALEDEMCDFGPDGLSSGRSPDRLDALVWALTDLMLRRGRSRACGCCSPRAGRNRPRRGAFPSREHFTTRSAMTQAKQAPKDRANPKASPDPVIEPD